ncbi:ABC transporter substrate-binding protein [Ovoidimarina sediminis]|uniref:ABC transporter substrate-binding protein n=1 Tax=Ovoidimarina sediminis TaxID=3079856 RepID=UPI00291102B6|nr:ABC transporter substrate-binding protein [Rhodophyticola sp. MJ-SS7]MDU8945151.1 ABC transporter substrate-binding protein [Rhodophyticola sp. MJ-SS7]
MPAIRAISLALAAWLFTGLAAGAETPPGRVVSINLCTDQLAMMLAAPGQLVSVSYLARDPMSSAMVADAAAYPPNRGLAEDVFLLQPDLVVAGAWTTPATAAMLERLGVRVERFGIAATPEEITGQIRRMGALLGRDPEAEAMANRFLDDVARLAASAAAAPRGRAATYHANGFTSGTGELSDLILSLAGYRNIADEIGLSTGGHLPLETLVLAVPDLVVTGERFPGVSRSEDVMGHPSLDHLAARAETDAGWVCGLPHILSAVEGLRE